MPRLSAPQPLLHLPTAAVARIRRIRFYKGECHSRGQYHISVGHMTVMATVTFFTDPSDAEGRCTSVQRRKPRRVHAMLPSHPACPSPCLTLNSTFPRLGKAELGPVPPCALDVSKKYAYADTLEQDGTHAQYAVLTFQKPVTCAPDALIIASRLDADAAAPSVSAGHLHCSGCV